MAGFLESLAGGNFSDAFSTAATGIGDFIGLDGKFGLNDNVTSTKGFSLGNLGSATGLAGMFGGSAENNGDANKWVDTFGNARTSPNPSALMSALNENVAPAQSSLQESADILTEPSLLDTVGGLAGTALDKTKSALNSPAALMAMKYGPAAYTAYTQKKAGDRADKRADKRQSIADNSLALGRLGYTGGYNA